MKAGDCSFGTGVISLFDRREVDNSVNYEIGHDSLTSSPDFIDHIRLIKYDRYAYISLIQRLWGFLGCQ